MAGQHLYIFQAKVTGALKIGRSDDPARRLGQVQTGCPYVLRIILIAPDKGKDEAMIHRAMIKHRTRNESGEWFMERGMGDIPVYIWEHQAPWYQEDPDWWKRE